MSKRNFRWATYTIALLVFATEVIAKIEGKVDNIEYESIKNLTSKKWLKSGELNIKC